MKSDTSIVNYITTTIKEVLYIRKTVNRLTELDTAQLMNCSKQAFVNMFNEVQLLADDENAGFVLSPAARYVHKFRRRKWYRFFERIWLEISTRGHDIKRQLIRQALEEYSLQVQGNK